ncbi:hypothetical protein AKJ46_00120 [candidate division MSBL1 archaeon SCGC-AAA833K04]|uniref:Uncharacterized protein n=1 Tax=candidate division MSBL1 archaeon SCGC-AAA833K04 TaxID=1698258 RepID=A0A133VT30_9EURY|nr:hypothetical protein AKJ46_00120 [candidate division MSBL1 archaeon SCGC-AAA833K04]
MDVKEVTKRLIKALKKAQVPYALTGGIAVNFYGFPRATHDVDVIVSLPKEKIHQPTSTLKEKNFEIIESEIEFVVEKGDRFTAQLNAYRVDFWLAKTGDQENVLERSQTQKILELQTKIITPEDLIVSKLRSGRGRDHEDMLGILIRQKEKLQEEYLTQRATALKLRGKLKELMREARKIEKEK